MDIKVRQKETKTDERKKNRREKGGTEKKKRRGRKRKSGVLKKISQAMSLIDLSCGR
jgi:hypothetical protein